MTPPPPALAPASGAVSDARSAAAALAAGARTLTEGLELRSTLTALARRLAEAVEADVVAVLRAGPDGALRIEAGDGLPPEGIGLRLEPGTGLAAKAMAAGTPLSTGDYLASGTALPIGELIGVRSLLALPLRWDGETRGGLIVGRRCEDHAPAGADRDLATAFAELAATAFRHDVALEGLAVEARTDGLTGLLNRRALEAELQREVARAERADAALSVIMLDLDGFKVVNERRGHLVGDEVLRRVAGALRDAARRYDLVGRFGGDEFVLVCPGAREAEALVLAERVLRAARTALAGFDLDATVATAGVAERGPRDGADHLLRRADDALLHGRRRSGRGAITGASTVAADAARAAGDAAGPDAPDAPAPERLLRRHRALGLVNALGTRLAAMTDPDLITEAVVDELHRAFGFFLCAVIEIDGDEVFARTVRGEPFVALEVAKWRQSKEVGVIGRCLRERRAMLVDDVLADERYVVTEQTGQVRSELCAPVFVGDELWGAINIEDLRVGAFDEDDASVVRTLADLLGAALRSALLYERLERAYLGTAEALAAALDAKDAYTADHADSVATWAVEVGRRLGLDPAQLRDLRYGAIFHDIGKIAIPEAILNKPGPLTPGERAVMERHTIVGEQILAPVDFLAGVRPIVRHEHERWDGTGYPDRLAGEQIPLGARIVFVCDAYHAMTSDRSYRSALPADVAVAELEANAGTQFDPAVVAAFVDVLRGGRAA